MKTQIVSPLQGYVSLFPLTCDDPAETGHGIKFTFIPVFPSGSRSDGIIKMLWKIVKYLYLRRLHPHRYPV